jgi:S1-C subfamily serine protease
MVNSGIGLVRDYLRWGMSVQYIATTGIHGRNIDEFLQVHGGDIVTALDHIPVNDTGEFISYIENHKSVGEKIIITVIGMAMQ